VLLPYMYDMPFSHLMNICRYVQLPAITDICNLLQRSEILLVISSNKYRYLYFPISAVRFGHLSVFADNCNYMHLQTMLVHLISDICNIFSDMRNKITDISNLITYISILHIIAGICNCVADIRKRLAE